MKSVLISIQPRWCELIANKNKSVEIRKTKPKIDTPFKCYIYQTKMRWLFSLLRKSGLDNLADRLLMGLGKVIGEFVCDEIICLDEGDLLFGMDEISDSQIEEYSCLSLDELFSYKGNKEYIYGWHISDLVIYDKPKELREFYTVCKMNCENCELWGYTRVNAEEFDMDCKSDWFNHKPLTRPPQSWCYVEERSA